MIPFKTANILIPNNIDMYKWCVVACDQYTSDPNYWDEVRKIVGDNPSTLKITLPEIFLNDNEEERIKEINNNMEEYIKGNIFTEYKDTMIYVERTQYDGRVREGIIGVVDLEEYSFELGSKTLIRATENTVIERIPPRVNIRKNALLELPHIMILIDDKEKKIIEQVKEKELIYDTDLMQKGGHIKGYKISKNDCNDIIKKLEDLVNEDNLLFAVGDGNHSLATAKVCYEELKKTKSKEEYLNHPGRFALVEIVNLHSDALEFEAIHRVLFDIDEDDFLKELKNYYKINENGNGQKIELISSNINKTIYIENPKSNIPVGSIQIFIDEYLKNHKGRIDYIHGKNKTIELATQKGNLGILLEPIKKDDLFKTVIVDGVLPRKTFSMGHSYDKRFYLEARKIK